MKVTKYHLLEFPSLCSYVCDAEFLAQSSLILFPFWNKCIFSSASQWICMDGLQLQVIFKYEMAPLIPFGEDIDYFLWQGFNKSILLSVLFF